MPITNALSKAISYLPAKERDTVGHALKLAQDWHLGQVRESGAPYVEHPIAVAQYLTQLEADSSTLIASLLHDVVEDERAKLTDVEREFGTEVAALVDGVTKLSKIEYKGRRTERQLGSLRKMLLTASADLRVIFIKLADRWHNVQTLGSLREDKQRRIADETLDIYVPFARLVGLWELKKELENLCFPLAYPEVCKIWHAEIRKVMNPLEQERRDFVERVNRETLDTVEASLDEMTDYEIFSKFQGNLSRLKEVSNIDSVLIIVKGSGVNQLDCYRVLGEIHEKYPVRFGSFRDFISTPQPNGYRALHTTIFLSRNHELKLRIQTQEMFDYVSNRKLSSWMDQQQNDIYAALNSLHAPSYDRESYMKDLKGTVLAEKINVFTPSGAIIALPQGATGIDFAFAMNPDHLSYLAGVRVNGESYEATHVLKDGDIAELVLLSSGMSRQRTMWLDKAKSVEARSSLKSSLMRASTQRKRTEGRSLLEGELRKRRLPVWWLLYMKGPQKRLAREFDASNFDSLLRMVGSGLVSVTQVIEAYKTMLADTKTPFQYLLKVVGLLPKSRILNKQSPIMDIEVYAKDRQGLIHDVTRCFAQRNINIAKFGVYAVPPKDALYKIRIEARNFEEFSDLYDALVQVPDVKRVLRKK